MCLYRLIHHLYKTRMRCCQSGLGYPSGKTSDHQHFKTMAVIKLVPVLTVLQKSRDGVVSQICCWYFNITYFLFWSYKNGSWPKCLGFATLPRQQNNEERPFRRATVGQQEHASEFLRQLRRKLTADFVGLGEPENLEFVLRRASAPDPGASWMLLQQHCSKRWAGSHHWDPELRSGYCRAIKG